LSTAEDRSGFPKESLLAIANRKSVKANRVKVKTATGASFPSLDHFSHPFAVMVTPSKAPFAID